MTQNNGAESATQQPSPGGTTRTIRLVIADDHALMRNALRAVLDGEGMEVVGEAANGREAVLVAIRARPDVVLMDLTMPSMGGIEAIRQIHRDVPSTRILVLSGYLDETRLVDAVRAGAAGYVVKDSHLDELRLAIRSVARQNTYFSTRVCEDLPLAELLRQAQQDPATGTGELLSAREREVLQLLAEGLSNQAVADELIVSVKTVEAHRSHIVSKISAKNRTDLVRYALRHGLVNLDVGGSRHAGDAAA